MTVPRFIDRAVDAVAPLLEDFGDTDTRARLETLRVRLDGSELDPSSPARCGFLLAANLLARFYGDIEVRAAGELASDAEDLIRAINPRCTIARAGTERASQPDYSLRFAAEAPAEAEVTAWAAGWNVLIDGGPSTGTFDASAQPSAAASCASAAIGVGELFRALFASELGRRGRDKPCESGFNLVTLGPPSDGTAISEEDHEVGTFYLVGAGAIGQATLYVLRHSGVVGTVCVVDPERLEAPNLQRYVLATDKDERSLKVALAATALKDTPLEVCPIEGRWSGALVQFDQQRPVLVALDNADDRISVQASLPGPIYNAYTQPADLGWSRHERFGTEPCLACLYWPTHAVPSRHEQIARALQQPELRVLAYLLSGTPIGDPLPAPAIPLVPGTQQRPDGADEWQASSLLDDLAAAAGIVPERLDAWRKRPVGDLYQEGICGGALLEARIGEVPREVLVPLAHQSVLAGVMLATQLIVCSDADLRQLRPSAVEGRYNVLSDPSQILPVPRTRTADCICSDPDFVNSQELKEVEDARVDEL